MGQIDINSLHSRGWSRAVAAATDITSGADCRVMGILCTGGSGAGVCSVYNAATAAGADLIVVKAAIGDSSYISCGPNGTPFYTGLSTTISGTGASFVVFYITE